jgi:hypothetical protein
MKGKIKMRNELYLRKKMRSTYLIQRLKKPKGPFMIGGVEFKDNPFAFGGGLKNGGFSDKAMNILRDIFEFDYMGAAEFEFGAVPEAVRFLAEQASRNNLVTGTVSLGENKNVYYISPKEYKEEVINRIKLLAKNKIHLKEACRLDVYFDKEYKKNRPWINEVVGWLEIDNGFMFFVGKEMYDKTCELFDLNNKEEK